MKNKNTCSCFLDAGMTMEDYKEVYSLWMSCKGMGLNNVDDSEHGIELFLDRNPQTCFVTEEDGKIVGVILAGNDGRRGYIYHTAVSPLHRNKGIAAKMLDKVCKALPALGIVKAALVVFERNADGNAFWEKQGFTCREDLIYRNKTLSYMTRIDYFAMPGIDWDNTQRGGTVITCHPEWRWANGRA